jgi:hypothetical protein
MSNEPTEHGKPRTFGEVGGAIIGGMLVIAGVVASAGVVVLAFRFLIWTVAGC